jgi:hypothetical protein
MWDPLGRGEFRYVDSQRISISIEGFDSCHVSEAITAPYSQIPVSPLWNSTSHLNQCCSSRHQVNKNDLVLWFVYSLKKKFHFCWCNYCVSNVTVSVGNKKFYLKLERLVKLFLFLLLSLLTADIHFKFRRLAFCNRFLIKRFSRWDMT